MRSTEYVSFMMSIHNLLILVRSNATEAYCKNILKIVVTHMRILLETGQISFKEFQDAVSMSLHESNVTTEVLEKLFMAQALKIPSDYSEISKYIEFNVEALELALKELELLNVQKAYKIIDAVHFIPEVLVNYENWRKQSYWNNNIKSNPSIWGKRFLEKWEVHFIEPKSIWGKLKSKFKEI